MCHIFSIKRDTDFTFLCYVIMDREWIVMLFTLVKGTDPALTCEKKQQQQTITFGFVLFVLTVFALDMKQNTALMVLTLNIS